MDIYLSCHLIKIIMMFIIRIIYKLILNQSLKKFKNRLILHKLINKKIIKNLKNKQKKYQDLNQ